MFFRWLLAVFILERALDLHLGLTNNWKNQNAIIMPSEKLLIQLKWHRDL